MAAYPVSGDLSGVGVSGSTSSEARESLNYRSLSIAGRLISDDEKAYLVAEIGHNHGGSLERALSMVDTAIASGADAVKFQTRVPVNVYASGKQPGAYDHRSTNPNWLASVYGKHREKLEFSHRQWSDLFAHCRRRGIAAFSTPFDAGSLEMLADFGVPAIKIASGDATNTPLIAHAATFGIPLIISTGGCSLAEVDRIVEMVTGTGTEFALLQCTCIYPAPTDSLNLRVIETFRKRYPGVVVGLSSHNVGWAPTLAAFALGGRIFEHHYTNDRDWIGTDNHFSLTPGSLRDLRSACDEVAVALGSSSKSQDPRERTFTFERRKSLYWERELPAGHRISATDLVPLCPGDGVQPVVQFRVAGMTLSRDVRARQRFDWEDIAAAQAAAADSGNRIEGIPLPADVDM